MKLDFEICYDQILKSMKHKNKEIMRQTKKQTQTQSSPLEEEEKYKEKEAEF